MNYQTNFKSVRGEVSAAEWQTRLDLAACYRLVDRYDMQDLIYNHITARIPGTPDHLLINLYGLLYKEITASSLVKVDLDGNILSKPISAITTMRDRRSISTSGCAWSRISVRTTP